MEVRSAYVADMRALAHMVGDKAVLLYFSQRKPDYIADPSLYEAWSGGYPHFVDRRMVDMVANGFKGYVEHVSGTGLPNELVDRETAEPIKLFPGAAYPTANVYYPSPEMHAEVALRLVDVLKSAIFDRLWCKSPSFHIRPFQ